MSDLQTLQHEIEAYHRGEVLGICKKESIADLAGDKKDEVIKQMIALRDMKIVAELMKQEKELSPEGFDLDRDNYQNRNFVGQAFDKYAKKIVPQSKESTELLFELACWAESEKILKEMIKKGEAKNCYFMLAGCGDEIFALVREIDKKEINGTLKVDMLKGALNAPEPAARIDELVAMGYDVREKNAEGESFLSYLENRIATYSYPKNKNGQLKKTKEKSLLQHISKEQKELETSNSNHSWKAVFGVMMAACILVVVVALAYGYNIANGSYQGTQEATTENTESNDQIDTEADENLLTDTSLKVEDGDTVNIDYTGYVDGEAFEGGTDQGASLTIGSGTFIDDFEEQLIGHSVGEEVEVNVTFPENYHEELKGKDATFMVTINGIYEE